MFYCFLILTCLSTLFMRRLILSCILMVAYIFLSLCRILLSVFWIAGLVLINFSSFCLSWKILLVPLIMRDCFAICSIYIDHYFLSRIEMYHFMFSFFEFLLRILLLFSRFWLYMSLGISSLQLLGFFFCSLYLMFKLWPALKNYFSGLIVSF
jgi:hypothetical protein